MTPADTGALTLTGARVGGPRAVAARRQAARPLVVGLYAAFINPIAFTDQSKRARNSRRGKSSFHHKFEDDPRGYAPAAMPPAAAGDPRRRAKS